MTTPAPKKKRTYYPKCACQARLRPDGTCSAGCPPELKRPHLRVRNSEGVKEKPNRASLVSHKEARAGFAKAQEKAVNSGRQIIDTNFRASRRPVGW